MLSFSCYVWPCRRGRGDGYCCCCCTRIIKCVITGRPPVLLELRNTPQGKITNEPNVVHKEYPSENSPTNQRWYPFTSQLTQFRPRPEIYRKLKSRASPRCAKSILVLSTHYDVLVAPGKNGFVLLATQWILPHVFYTCYLSLHIGTSDASELKQKKQGKKNMRKERKETEKKKGKRERKQSMTE